MQPRIDKDRLQSRLDHMASLTVAERPWERTAFSDLHRTGRVWLAEQMRSLGLETRLDAAANLIGQRHGTDNQLKPISIGSHSDTVPSGGRFDGIVGVVAGLEIAEALAEAGYRLRHPLEIIDFLAEEPNKYGLSCVGSRAMVGALEARMLDYIAPDGTRLSEGLAFMGGSPDALDTALRWPGDIAAFLEIHIEQARVLEASGGDIGAVTAIAGIERLEVKVTGRADHAGATPMGLRKDALVAAAHMVVDFEEKAKATQDLVATVGKLNVLPNAANAVPEEVRFTLEVRSNSSNALSAYIDWSRRRIEQIAQARELSVAVQPVSRSEPVNMAPALRHLIGEAAQKRGYRHQAMPSGAGHDAAYMARLAPTGMIFIPCLEGRSHCPEEFASPEQILAGVQVLLDVLLQLDETAIETFTIKEG